MKTCKSCKEVLPLSFFHKDNKNKDGRKTVCKKCRSKRKIPMLTESRKKFDRNIKHQVYVSIKENRSGKGWEDLFGYTLADLKKHLEAQFEKEMSWDNFGKCWWVDRIIPCSRFKYSDLEEFHKCWCLKNLRPAYKAICQKKSNKIYLSLVEKYSLYDILPIGVIHFEKEEIE